MKVKYPKQPRPLKYDHFVTFMLQTDVSLGRGEPSVLLLKMLHSNIKIVQESVTQ